MQRFLQLHLLTFYPPANLNRDDAGKPKTAVMGGEMRLRVSSQALKRAWRTSDVFKNALADHRGERTQRIGALIEEHLLQKGIPAPKAREIAVEIAGVFGKVKPADAKKPPEEDKQATYTEQLAFISSEEKTAAVEYADARAAGGDALEKKKLVEKLLRGHDAAADIAMFGRMLADNPEFNREAAVSVAHAVTTHRVAVEDDYYTAVDDLKKPSEDAGAGFIGEAGFGSGVFYLYILVDRALLIDNLGGDKALAKKAIAALTEAAATAGPSGKAKSYGSYARTSFMLAELGDAAPRTLAAAFVEPIDRPEPPKPRPNDFLSASIKALTDIREKFNAAYPDDVTTDEWFSVPDGKGALPDIVRFAASGL